jgi:hypothetical protein
MADGEREDSFAQGEAGEKYRTKVHGFKKHTISNFLQDRHPYIPVPYSQRYDSKEVFHSVFDRSIPKLVEILDMENLPDQNYREAFMLLNEMASHQENKMIMIDSGLVTTSLVYMRHPDAEVRRESTSLLGSLLSVKKGRDVLPDEMVCQVFSPMLLQDQLKCREVCGWMLCRMTSGRDGVEKLIRLDQVQYIIRSFKENSDKFSKDEAMFLIYLLECMACILQTDDGIEHFVSTSAMKRYNEILLREDQPFGEYETRIRYLCLYCTSLIAMSSEGKEESIKHNMIKTANKYLRHEDEDVVNSATRLIMFSSIHLDGKTLAVAPQDDEIITNLIALLEHKNKDIVRNAEIAIRNISELPKGFMIISKYLSSHLPHLDKIFGSKAIVPLYSLLFKIDRPPFVTVENKDAAMRYALAISYFINHPDHRGDALNYAIEKTCKIVDRLLPLLLINTNQQGQAEIAKAVQAICEEDEKNRASFQQFLVKHGEFQNPLYETNLLNEVANYKELFDIYQFRQEEKQETAQGQPQPRPTSGSVNRGITSATSPKDKSAAPPRTPPKD